MAHFAKIGLNNKVINVVNVNNNELKDANGVEQEVLGIQFLEGTTGWFINGNKLLIMLLLEKTLLE